MLDAQYLRVNNERLVNHLFNLFYRVLQLMNLTDSRLTQRGSEKLELAILSFFEQFRKIYVGDQAQKTSKVNCKNDLSFWQTEVQVTCQPFYDMTPLKLVM